MTYLGVTTPYYGGGQVQNPANVISTTGAPAASNIHHTLGTLAIDNTTGTIYGLASLQGGSAVWAILGGGTGAVATITGNSGGILSPTGGNFNLFGTANQITTSGSGSTLTWSLVGPYTPATYTAHGVLMGEGTSSIAASSAGTSGQVFTSGGASADGAYQNIGTNSGLTNHGVLLGQGNSAFAATAVGTNGQVLIGSTGANPAFGTITSSTGLTFTLGAASLAINLATSEIPFTIVSGTSQAMSIANGYQNTNGSLTTFTLPTNATVGDVVEIMGGGTGGWRITYATNQQIIYGNQTTTLSSGNLASTNTYDCVKLRCSTTSATIPIFQVVSSIGNLTVA